MDQAVHRDGDWPSRGTLSGLVHVKNRKKRKTIYSAKHFLSRERVDTIKKVWRARNTKKAAKGKQKASKNQNLRYYISRSALHTIYDKDGIYTVAIRNWDMGPSNSNLQDH